MDLREPLASIFLCRQTNLQILYSYGDCKEWTFLSCDQPERSSLDKATNIQASSATGVRGSLRAEEGVQNPSSDGDDSCGREERLRHAPGGAARDHRVQRPGFICLRHHGESLVVRRASTPMPSVSGGRPSLQYVVYHHKPPLSGGKRIVPSIVVHDNVITRTVQAITVDH